MSANEWLTQGKRILLVGRAWRWWFGDWLLYGERRFPQQMEQVDLVGHDPAMVAACMDVARRFPPTKRRAGLSWTHHHMAGVLDDDRAELLLGRAERERLTTADLRALIQQTGTETLDERCDERERDTPERAAPPIVQPSKRITSQRRVLAGVVAASEVRLHVVSVQVKASSASEAERVVTDALAGAEGVIVLGTS